tara:strand:+ start:491 stop:859 length:369 start_codon:yes stop_codon:yes gene_type:complete
MASTRNRNTKGDYLQEGISNQKNFSYTTYQHSQYGKPDNFLDVYKLPNSTQATRSVGLENLSHNPIDIDSYLKGISATNLEKPTPKRAAHLKEYSSIDFYNRVPLLLPDEVKTDQKQRPLLI